MSSRRPYVGRSASRIGSRYPVFPAVFPMFPHADQVEPGRVCRGWPAGPVDGLKARYGNMKSKKNQQTGAGDGNRPPWPAWKAGAKLWRAIPVGRHDPEEYFLDFAELSFWVEILVATAAALRSVNIGAALSSSMHPDAGHRMVRRAGCGLARSFLGASLVVQCCAYGAGGAVQAAVVGAYRWSAFGHLDQPVRHTRPDGSVPLVTAAVMADAARSAGPVMAPPFAPENKNLMSGAGTVLARHEQRQPQSRPRPTADGPAPVPCHQVRLQLSTLVTDRDICTIVHKGAGVRVLAGSNRDTCTIVHSRTNV